MKKTTLKTKVQAIALALISMVLIVSCAQDNIVSVIDETSDLPNNFITKSDSTDRGFTLDPDEFSGLIAVFMISGEILDVYEGDTHNYILAGKISPLFALIKWEVVSGPAVIDIYGFTDPNNGYSMARVNFNSTGTVKLKATVHFQEDGGGKAMSSIILISVRKREMYLSYKKDIMINERFTINSNYSYTGYGNLNFEVEGGIQYSDVITTPTSVSFIPRSVGSFRVKLRHERNYYPVVEEITDNISAWKDRFYTPTDAYISHTNGMPGGEGCEIKAGYLYSFDVKYPKWISCDWYKETVDMFGDTTREEFGGPSTVFMAAGRVKIIARETQSSADNRDSARRMVLEKWIDVVSGISDL